MTKARESPHRNAEWPGIGGKQVKDQEGAAIEEIALTLGIEAPPADR